MAADSGGGEGREGRSVDEAGGGRALGDRPSGAPPRGHCTCLGATASSRGCRGAHGIAPGGRHLPVTPLVALAAVRLRPPRATRLGPASSHLAGLAAGPLKETQASRDVAAPGLRRPGGGGREAGTVTQPDLRPGIAARPLGQPSPPSPLKPLLPAPPVGNNLRNQLNRWAVRARRFQD